MPPKKKPKPNKVSPPAMGNLHRREVAGKPFFQELSIRNLLLLVLRLLQPFSSVPYSSHSLLPML